MELQITEEAHGGAVVLAPSGRLDTSTAKVLDEHVTRVLAEPCDVLLLDMPAVPYVSSFGLRVILSAAKRMSGNGGKLVLCGLLPEVHDVFRVSGFLKIIDVFDDREAALAKLD